MLVSLPVSHSKLCECECYLFWQLIFVIYNQKKNMSEQMKYLVAELNKSPYDRNYNLISFDALQGDQLLQILSDVLAEIDAKNKIDIREEEPESTVIRILGMLRILKYKPPDEISHNFRQGLVEGHKQVFM